MVVLHRDNFNVKAAAQTEVSVVLECCIMTVILAAIAGGICVINYKNVFLHSPECRLFVFICIENICYRSSE